jgi:outer membrane protein OmpA-like peptidoglycan-associated protein
MNHWDLIMKNALTKLTLSAALLSGCSAAQNKPQIADATANTPPQANDSTVPTNIAATENVALRDYMDSQQQALQQALHNSEIDIERSSSASVSLIMPSSMAFSYDRPDLSKDAKQSLSALVQVLNRYADCKIAVTGHTDDSGQDSYNQRLSEQRAASVAHFLIQHGVAATRISQRGMGESKPKLPNTSNENRAANRRVEIVISATGKT